MRIKTLMLGVGLALALPLPALAQRGGHAVAADWELLGEEQIGIGRDRDVINLRHNEGYYRDRSYRRLRFLVSGGEVQLRTIRLVYLNGHTEELQINRNMHSGENVDVDLRGERSYLARIEMFYKGKFGLSIGGGGLRINQASIKVFGENVRRAPPPPPPAHRPPVASLPPGWSVAATARFDRADRRVVIPMGRGAGTFTRIRLQQSGDSISVQNIAVTYGNGEVQNFVVSQRLEDGETTRMIDLNGNRRFIERIVVELDPRRRPGIATLSVLGDAGPAPGGPGPGHGGRGNWVPLGKQSVGFGVDRDVIRIGQSEDFFRNRGFDRLHFVAENNEVFMRSIRVVYMNGYSEDYNVERLIAAGGDLSLDLRGRRSYIREIEMTYRARRGFNGRAVVSVFGEPPRRR